MQTVTFLCLGPGSLRGLVRQLSIDQFENEGRRVSTGSVDPAARAGRSPLNLGLDRKSFSIGIHKVRALCTSHSELYGIINRRYLRCLQC